MIALLFTAGIALAILLGALWYLRNLAQSRNNGILLLPIESKAPEEPYTPIDEHTSLQEAPAKENPVAKAILVEVPKEEVSTSPENNVIAEDEFEPVPIQQSAHVPPVVSEISQTSSREDIPLLPTEKESEDTEPQPRARRRLSLRRVKSRERKEKGDKNAGNGGLFTGLLRRTKSPENNMQVAEPES